MSGDSIYNGTRDNAIGVATLLGLARHFQDDPPARPILFVFFTAEEKGLLGSEYFVKNSPIPLHRIRFNFNCDNGGYTDTDLLTVVGHHRLNGLENIDQWLAPAGLRHFEPVELAARLFHQSDNVHFANQGIPAPSVGMGFTGFTDELTKYYHKPADHWENFDPTYMKAYWQGVRNLAVQLIKLDELPFWKESDPLFEKGRTLYQVSAK
jgi:Zn-dependent M28 family amino/carboxypeptidase